MKEAQFLTIIREHQGIIHKICRLYRDKLEDREDLFQEIVFQLWKARLSFRHEAKIGTWIYRIALNTSIATFRKKTQTITYLNVLPDQIEEQFSDELLLRQEKLFVALKKLNEADRAIITLYMEDLSYQEIAEIIGISDNYVGVRLNRIKNRLKKLITS